MNVMSEGTMQRAAESDQREPRVARTIRTRRPSRVLVGAAVVPVMLLAVGCSSESDSASDDDVPSEAVESALADSATPEVVEAAYASLPDACEVFSEKTLKSVVPQGVKSGKAINAAEENVTGDCRWISLDNNGVDGSQYRWLSVSLHLLASNAANGPGEDRAAKAYESKVTAAKAVDGAKNVKTEPVTGTGDQATAVLYDLKKDGDTFKQQTIVVRTENVVITLDYNGAGLAGEKTPDAAALLKTATSAAKEAVEAVEEANDTDASSSASPSKSASKTPSNGATKASSSGGSGADVSSDSDSDSDSSTSGRKKTSR